MRKRILAALFAPLLLVAGLFTAQAASATSIVLDPEVCVEDPGQPYIEAEYATEYQFTRTVVTQVYVPAVEEISHTDKEYKNAVWAPVEWQYVKQVQGNVQRSWLGVFGWENVGTFGWENWSGNSTQWSNQNVSVLQSGPHSSVQSEWWDGSWKYRELSTSFQYVQNGQVREDIVDWTVQWFHEGEYPSDPWIYTGNSQTHVTQEYVAEIPEETEVQFTWSEETSLDGWTATGETRSGEGVTRLIDPGQPYIPPTECPEDPEDPFVTIGHELTCGSVDITVAHNTDWRYGVTVEFEDMGDSVVVIGPGSETLTFAFEEDEYEGSITGRYFVTDATEWDLVPADLNYQATWPEVGDAFREFTVDTDCEVNPDPEPEPEPEPTPTPTPTPTPAQPAAPAPAQPSFTG